MREIIGNYSDVIYKKSRIERILCHKHRRIVYMLPKYLCELNPIERVRAQAKRYTKAYCKHNIQSLCDMTIPALDTVNKKIFRAIEKFTITCLHIWK